MVEGQLFQYVLVEMGVNVFFWQLVEVDLIYYCINGGINGGEGSGVLWCLVIVVLIGNVYQWLWCQCVIFQWFVQCGERVVVVGDGDEINIYQLFFVVGNILVVG